MKPTPTQLRALARSDPVLGRAMRHVAPYPGFPEGRQTDSHFHALARTIIYQQLAGAAARTIHDRVRRLTPGARFPRPPEVLELSDGELRGAGLSQSKMLALRDLAARTLDGTVKLRSLSRCSDEEVIEQLVVVRGIGEWSAQMFLLFRLGRLDVIAPGDLGLQEGLRRLDGLDGRPRPAELLERSEPWRPLRSVASWVLWRLVSP